MAEETKEIESLRLKLESTDMKVEAVVSVVAEHLATQTSKMMELERKLNEILTTLEE